MTSNVPAKPEAAIAMRQGHGLVINNNTEALRFAQFVVDNRLAPPSYKTAQDVFIGIVAGMEHGFTATQSLAAVAVINQKPCLYGDALPALVHKSGKCEYLDERFEGEGDDLTAVCEVKRNDQSRSVTRTFSVADAKAANLWGRGGPWRSYPKRMLQMRARAFALRDAFADVLAGFGVMEEVQDYAEPRNANTTTRQPVVDQEPDPLLEDLDKKSAKQDADKPEAEPETAEITDEEKAAIVAEEQAQA